jgi:hypothetical protein
MTLDDSYLSSLSRLRNARLLLVLFLRLQAKTKAGLSHAEIAVLFRMPSSNSVAQTIRRTKSQDAHTPKVLKHQISHK